MNKKDKPDHGGNNAKKNVNDSSQDMRESQKNRETRHSFENSDSTKHKASENDESGNIGRDTSGSDSRTKNEMGSSANHVEYRHNKEDSDKKEEIKKLRRTLDELRAQIDRLDGGKRATTIT